MESKEIRTRIAMPCRDIGCTCFYCRPSAAVPLIIPRIPHFSLQTSAKWRGKSTAKTYKLIRRSSWRCGDIVETSWTFVEDEDCQEIIYESSSSRNLISADDTYVYPCIFIFILHILYTTYIYYISIINIM